MIRVSIDPTSAREFRRDIREWAKITGEPVEQAICELSKSCAKQLAQKVPPFGLSNKIGERFMGSIAKQVDRAVKAGNVGAVSGSTAKQVHDRSRDSKGQVPKDLRTRGRRVKSPVTVRDKETLIREMQANAGLAKGAWIHAGNSLPKGKPISGIGRWITRHLSGGSAQVRPQGISTQVTLTNERPWISRLQPERLVQGAMNAGFNNTARYMQRIIDKAT